MCRLKHKVTKWFKKPAVWEVNMAKNIGWLGIVGSFGLVAAAEAQTPALSTTTTAFDGTYTLVSSTAGTYRRS